MGSFTGRKHTAETKAKLSKIAMGRPSAFKGKKHSEATKQLFREMALKRDKSTFKKTDEHKRKIGEARKRWLDKNHWWKEFLSKKYAGEGGSNWQGGKTATALKDRKGMRYQMWRKAVFERDNYTCQECNLKGGWNVELKRRIVLNADHIKMYSTHPELRFELSNGRTLCHDCHKATPTWGGLTKFKKKTLWLV